MKFLLAANAVPLALLALSGYIAHLDKSGWGWLVAAAVLCSVAPKHLPTPTASPDAEAPGK